MVGLSFNSTAASALSLLTGSAKAVQRAQSQFASGLKVAQASDNAAYWSIATTMKAHTLSLSSAEDATGLAAAMADSAALGIEAATDVVTQIQSKLVLAKSLGGAGNRAIDGEISALKDQLTEIARSSAFNGENWLSLEAGQAPKVESLVASVSSNRDGDLSVNVIDFDTAASVLVSAGKASDGILTRAYSGTTRDGAAYDYFLIDSHAPVPNGAGARAIALNDQTSSAEIDGMIAAVDAMRAGLAEAGAQIGATSSQIDRNGTFLRDLQELNEISIGGLVDADMGEAAVTLAARTVQQQLQTQALHIANSSGTTTIDLFV